MDKNKIYWIFFAAAFIFLLFWGNISFQPAEKPARYINVYLNISNYSNAWMEGDNIYFASILGKAIKGSTYIKNNENKKMKFKLELEGELADKKMISISNSSFELNSGVEKEIQIVLSVPISAKGNYFGRIRITR